MSTRKVYLVAYDVTNKKRLRQTHKKMRGYGDALQYSLFWCVLSDTERELMTTALTEIIDVQEDRIMIADLGSRDGKRVDGVRFLGKRLEEPEEGPVVF